MRTKILQKKLVLNKKTIAHLDNDDLGKVKGGIYTVTCRPGCVTGIPSQCAPCPVVTYVTCTCTDCYTALPDYCVTKEQGTCDTKTDCH
jgi:hypothetical protein